jgi:hypothetical protein
MQMLGALIRPRRDLTAAVNGVGMKKVPEQAEMRFG